MRRIYIRRWVVLATACAALAVTAAAAVAQDKTQKYVVTGFREARFSQTEDQVRAAAVKSFGAKDADFSTSTNPMEGTTVLTVKVPSIEPGPGPARVSYIFGYKSKRLIQVNVIWGEETANPSIDVNRFTGVGTQLAQYFNGYAWKKDATRAGVPVGENTVVLFSGDDEQKGSVRVVLDGVKFQFERDGKQTSSPDPKTPPKLIISYVSDRELPDVIRIEKGKF